MPLPLVVVLLLLVVLPGSRGPYMALWNRIGK
jgi:hypothetical protein